MKEKNMKLHTIKRVVRSLGNDYLVLVFEREQISTAVCLNKKDTRETIRLLLEEVNKVP